MCSLVDMVNNIMKLGDYDAGNGFKAIVHKWNHCGLYMYMISLVFVLSDFMH